MSFPLGIWIRAPSLTWIFSVAPTGLLEGLSCSLQGVVSIPVLLVWSPPVPCGFSSSKAPASPLVSHSSFRVWLCPDTVVSVLLSLIKTFSKSKRRISSKHTLGISTPRGQRRERHSQGGKKGLPDAIAACPSSVFTEISLNISVIGP